MAVGVKTVLGSHFGGRWKKGNHGNLGFHRVVFWGRHMERVGRYDIFNLFPTFGVKLQPDEQHANTRLWLFLSRTQRAGLFMWALFAAEGFCEVLESSEGWIG